MGLNSSPSLLDSPQIVKRIFDATNDAVRITLAEATGIAIELNAADGDSALAVGTTDGTTSGTQKVFKLDTNGVLYIRGDSISGQSAALDGTSVGTVIDPIDCSGIKSFQIYAEVLAADDTTATAGQIEAKIDLSPVTSGDTFVTINVALNVPPGTDVGVVAVSDLITNLIAKRARLSLTANQLVGNDSVRFFIVGSSV